MHVNEERLAETAAALRDGDGDPREYALGLCDRIDQIDGAVQAVLSEEDRRSRLRDEAESLVENHPDPSDRPPLFGVPVGVKDIFHVDGFTTRAGSAVPPEVFAGPEATVVERLRGAGALVLGKTVTTEFAGFAPGPTRNPHDLGHTPGGSSSGSAAAVAAGICPLALGTQTGGSVVRPAAYCGIVGFKPSYGRIPTDGVLPRSESVDHVGLFTQDVPGMRLAASVVCDGWDASPSVDRPTVGVPEGPFLDRASDEMLDAFRAQVESLRSAGYDVRGVRAFDDDELESIDRLHPTVIRGELVLVHDEWFDEFEPFYRAPLADRIRDGREVTVGELATARTGIRRVRESIHETMSEEGIDLWVCPVTPEPAPEGITDIGPSSLIRPWTYAGLPSLSLPAGTIDGLPIGLQCVGRFDADERLLAWAERLDEELGDGRLTGRDE